MRGLPGGYAFLTPDDLRRALRDRAITQRDIDRAAAVLAGPDPAGVLQPPLREELEHVAAYLHIRLGWMTIPGLAWTLIQKGHPAARAVYWHEFQELESYLLLGVRDPLQVRLGVDDHYWQAHARACWEEARYWERWAAAAGKTVKAQAFLLAHPLRTPEETDLLREELHKTWQVDLYSADMVNLDEARRFYREQEMTPEGIQRWR